MWRAPIGPWTAGCQASEIGGRGHCEILSIPGECCPSASTVLASVALRTIIVGDVHGCRVELESLLDRVGFGSGDRLIFVGDLVARGPDSLGVLDVVRRTGAIVVRGNHEQKILDARAGLSALSKIHRDVAEALRPIDWSILETSRLWLDLPEHDVRVIHAGVDPRVAFSGQNERSLLSIRTIEDVLWGAHYQGPPHIVFGHNAPIGLQLHRWATGLDSGCVYGGALTAMVLAHGQKVPRGHEARWRVLVSERARRIWYAPKKRTAA